MSTTKNNLELEWRRNKVLELSSQGHTQSEIASILKVTQPTINKDLSYIKRKASESLQKHISENLPHEYQKCMVGINQVLNMAWSIVNKSLDDKVKLQALTLINDCNKYKMDLTTNGSLVMDSVKIVESQLNHLNGMEKKILQDINNNKRNREQEQKQEEKIGGGEDDLEFEQQQQQQQKNTTNGIF